MTKRGKRRFVIFLCAAAVILVAAGIIRVKLHPPRPLHEQIADYMYHSRTDPKLNTSLRNMVMNLWQQSTEVFNLHDFLDCM